MTIEPEAHELPLDVDGADAFLKHFEETDRRLEEPADASPVEEAQGASEPPVEPSTAATEDDDPDVELPFGEELKKFKLKDVRAAIEAREASEKGTAESQRVVSEATERSTRAQTALDKMIGQAKERYAPYANVDWLALSRDPQIDHASFVALREDAQKAHSELQFLEQELGAVTAQQTQVNQAAHAASAQACIAELTDPVKGLKGFGPELYNTLMAFADSAGMPQIRQSTSPAAIRLLHDAMLYRQGQTTVTTQVKKVVNQPTKVIRPGGSQASGGNSSLSSAMAKLRSSGSLDDATAAFAAHLAG